MSRPKFSIRKLNERAEIRALVTDHGSCVGSDEADWFSDSREEQETAKVVCGNCPANLACAVMANSVRIYGIHGNSQGVLSVKQKKAALKEYRQDPNHFIDRQRHSIEQQIERTKE